MEEIMLEKSFFAQSFADEVNAFSKDTSKETRKEFANKLKAEYKRLDAEVKASIKENLVKLNNEHKAELEEITKNKEEALAKAQAEFDANPNKSDKAVQKEHNNIVVGINTVAKRSKIKANSNQILAIKNEKLRRYDLHEEYIALLKQANSGVGLLKLKSAFLEWQAGFNLKASLTNKTMWINLVPLFMLVLIILAYAIGKGATGYNGSLADVINNGIFVAVVATGAVYIYSQGGFDMSLGNAALMCATITALLYNSTGNIFVSLAVSIVLGAVLGIINAILATMLNLPVMVMTLTMMNILAAIQEAILGNVGGLINVKEGMVNNPWVFAAFLVGFFILCWFLFNYSKLGRRNKFIGSNRIAAKFNGINLMQSGIISFALSGIGLGICGFLFVCSKTDSQFGAQTVLGQVGLNVVIAIVFGGMTTSGGPKSKVSCAIIGAFFSVFLDEFFAAISTPTFQVGSYCYMVKGLIFIIVSLANMWDTRTKMLASGGSIQ